MKSDAVEFYDEAITKIAVRLEALVLDAIYGDMAKGIHQDYKVIVRTLLDEKLIGFSSELNKEIFVKTMQQAKQEIVTEIESAWDGIKSRFK